MCAFKLGSVHFSNRSKIAGNRIKYDRYRRLYFVLYWLVTGAEFRQIEAFYGWSKSAVQLEMAHMLRAIIHGLDQFLQWPSIEERERMGSRYSGLFQNCVGIMDASEHPIRKVKNREVEISTYSGYFYLQLNVIKQVTFVNMLSIFQSSENISNLGKQSCNTIKTLSVIDRNGSFRFVHTGRHGGANDRDQFTSSCLTTSPMSSLW